MRVDAIARAAQDKKTAGKARRSEEEKWFLLRAVALRPRDEDLSNRSTELNAGNVVHREMNAAPDSRIAGFLAHGTNEIRTRREQIGQHLRLCRGERRMV